MRRARLHWFWRAAIAVLVGSGVNIAINVGLARLLPEAAYGSTPLFVALALVRVTIPVVAYGLLTYWLGARTPADRETRCRGCGYILRGISEPRCPECGERI